MVHMKARMELLKSTLIFFLFNRVQRYNDPQVMTHLKIIIALPGKHKPSLVDDSVWKLLPREQFREIQNRYCRAT